MKLFRPGRGGQIWDLWEDLGVPIQAFIAGGGDSWRKPSTDMWDFMCRHCNGVRPDTHTHTQTHDTSVCAHDAVVHTART